MTTNAGEKLKGSWDYVDGENFDAYMKEIGVSMMMRMTARGIKPRLVIFEENGKWVVRSESSIRNHVCEFVLGVEFDEETADGRKIRSTIQFEGDRWIHSSVDKQGRKFTVVRYVDEKGQHMVEMECNGVKARRWYKRVA